MTICDDAGCYVMFFFGSIWEVYTMEEEKKQPVTEKPVVERPVISRPVVGSGDK